MDSRRDFFRWEQTSEGDTVTDSPFFLYIFVSSKYFMVIRLLETRQHCEYAPGSKSKVLDGFLFVKGNVHFPS